MAALRGKQPAAAVGTGDGDIRAIWAVAPDGTGRTLLTRCPERENQPLTSLLREDDTGFWFELMDLTDGTSHIAFLPAGGTELTVSPAQPGRLLQAADGIRYSLDFPQGQMEFQATDLHTGVTTTLCTVSDQWTFLLRDNCLYFCDWQDDCALYTKSLGNTDPPVLRCRLESLGGSSYAWPVEARGSRLVLERAGAQWAVNLDTGARVWVQPAWMQPGTDGPCGAYPQVEEGSLFHNLCAGDGLRPQRKLVFHRQLRRTDPGGRAADGPLPAGCGCLAAGTGAPDRRDRTALKNGNLIQFC